MSTFDAQAFLNSSTDEQGSTKIQAFPAGDYVATIEKVDARSGVIGKGERQGEPWIALEVTYKLQDFPGNNLDEIVENIGRGDRLVRQSYFLDMNSDGSLDMGAGKNLRLNRLREAVGQNKAGQAWSPQMLAGAGPIVIRVTQDPSEQDPEEVYNRVSRTAPMGTTY